MRNIRPQVWAVAALILLAGIWSYNWVLMKIAVRYASPFDFAAMRAFYGAISLFLVLLAQRRSLKPPAVKSTFWYGVLQSGGTVGLSTWALVSGGAGKTAILTYTMSFWTLLLAWVFLQETLKTQQWYSLGVAAVGLMLIMVPLNLTSDLVSKGLAVSAGITWAVASIVLKKTDKQSIDPLSFTAWQMLFGSLPLIAVSLWLPPSSVQWTPEFVGVLIYNIIPGSAIAWLLWFYVLTYLSTDIASLGALLVPIFSIPMAALQLEEFPTATELTGIVLILAALVVNSTVPKALSKRLNRYGS